MATDLHIIIIFLFAFACLYLYLAMTHLPRFKVDQKSAQQIKTYGLIHFTLNQNVESILKEGLIPDDSKKMSFLEKDMVWFFDADPAKYHRNLAEVRSKGFRKDVDTVVLFKKDCISISELKMRRKPQAIVHIGRVDSKYLEVMSIDAYEQKYISKNIA